MPGVRHLGMLGGKWMSRAISISVHQRIVPCHVIANIVSCLMTARWTVKSDTLTGSQADVPGTRTSGGMYATRLTRWHRRQSVRLVPRQASSISDEY